MWNGGPRAPGGKTCAHGSSARGSPCARCSLAPTSPTLPTMLCTSWATIPTTTLLPALAVLAQRAPFTAAARSAQQWLACRGASASAGAARAPLAPPARLYAAAAGAPEPDVFSLIQPRRRQPCGLLQVRARKVWGAGAATLKCRRRPACSKHPADCRRCPPSSSPCSPPARCGTTARSTTTLRRHWSTQMSRGRPDPTPTDSCSRRRSRPLLTCCTHWAAATAWQMHLSTSGWCRCGRTGGGWVRGAGGGWGLRCSDCGVPGFGTHPLDARAHPALLHHTQAPTMPGVGCPSILPRPSLCFTCRS